MMDSMQAEAVKVEDAVETLSTLSDLSARADVTPLWPIMQALADTIRRARGPVHHDTVEALKDIAFTADTVGDLKTHFDALDTLAGVAEQTGGELVEWLESTLMNEDRDPDCVPLMTPRLLEIASRERTRYQESKAAAVA